MKKSLIASIVGGLIIFFWQFLSNAALDLHRPASQYTPEQDTIMAFLSTHLKEGKYFLPNTPDNATSTEKQKLMEDSGGRPWAIIDYKEQMNTNMGMNMIRGLLTDIIMVWLLCWILLKGRFESFNAILTTSVIIGFMSFLYFPYANFVWYESPGIYADLLDYIAGWALCGIWLGYYLKGKKTSVTESVTS